MVGEYRRSKTKKERDYAYLDYIQENFNRLDQNVKMCIYFRDEDTVESFKARGDAEVREIIASAGKSGGLIVA